MNSSNLSIEVLFTELQEFMNENNLNTNDFYKQLLDDLYISKKTVGHNMFSAVRWMAQGNQRAYNINTIPDNLQQPHMNIPQSQSPMLHTPPRANSMFGNVLNNLYNMISPVNDDDSDNESADNPREVPEEDSFNEEYQISQNRFTSYSTPMRRQTMQTLSMPQGPNGNI